MIDAAALLRHVTNLAGDQAIVEPCGPTFCVWVPGGDGERMLAIQATLRDRFGPDVFVFAGLDPAQQQQLALGAA